MKLNNSHTLITILLAMAILFSCTSCRKENSNLQERDIKPISIYFVSDDRAITITYTTDISDVFMLIEKMTPLSNVTETDEWLSGEIIYSDGKKLTFSLSESTVKLGDRYLSGINECTAIRRIFNRYIYDKKYILEEIESAKSIIIRAKDQNEEVLLDNRQKDSLLLALEKSDIKYNDDIQGAFVESYPNYTIELYHNGMNGIKKEIKLINPKWIIVMKNGIESYSTDESLWSFAANIIPPQPLNDSSSILYMFNASKVQILGSNVDGDYTGRLPWIVRILSEAERTVTAASDKNYSMEIKFSVKEKTFEVHVYENGFVYEDKYYVRKGILKDLESMLKAG